MRSSLPPIATLETIVDKLRHHQSEVAVFSGMLASLSLITGGALSVLLSPNLGQQLSFPSILKPGSLQEGHISMFGNTILELSRPLRIEIVEETTSGERQKSTDERTKSETESLSIVSPAEFQPQLLEEAHNKGTRLLILTLIATGSLYGATRLLPHIPLGPKRRKPLGERLANATSFICDHPLAVKPMPRLIPTPTQRGRENSRQASIPFSHQGPITSAHPSASSTSTVTTVIPPNATSLAISVHPEQKPGQKRRIITLQTPFPGKPSPSAAISLSNEASQSSISTTQLQQRTGPIPPQLSLPKSAPSNDWLSELDMRQEQPLHKIL